MLRIQVGIRTQTRPEVAGSCQLPLKKGRHIFSVDGFDHVHDHYHDHHCHDDHGLYSDFWSSLGTHAHLDTQHQVCQDRCMKWDLRLYICKSLGTQVTVYMFGDRYITIKNLHPHILLWPIIWAN